ncbi:MAG TPA: peptide chain release factor N(5)-glutamine methyltransferase, partial [Dehalococcoidia bacterium]|nr:peptide chain release factor N(5)-glutamine methyltransferase [Dehalococcoidia bacterium]
MTLGEKLSEASRALKTRGIPDPSLEAQVLLAHALGLSHAQILARPERPLSPAELDVAQSILDRRLKREPTAYILNRKEFYGRDFYVDRRVLIPRPETELLVERALDVARGLGGEVMIAEVGTGSGAVAISLALELPRARLFALDISPEALEVAGMNSRKYGVDGQVRLIQGDMLSPLPTPVHIVVANLPYVPDMAKLPPELLYEPALALRGGPDGLDAPRAFLLQVSPRLLDGGSFLLEIGAGQEGEVRRLVLARFPGARVSFSPDLGGIPRVVEVT